MKKLWFGVLIISVVVGAGLYTFRTSGLTHADASDPKLVALGKQVYAENCASCHGENLSGQTNWQERDEDGYLPAPPHDETGHTWHHADKILFQITKDGVASIAPEDYKTTMKGFADILSDKEIWASLAYIKSTWPEKERSSQDRVTKSSEQ